VRGGGETLRSDGTDAHPGEDSMGQSTCTDLPVRSLAEPPERLLPGRPDGDRMRILGHRGSPAVDCPENSVAAVTRALRQGADGVEIDVRLTADDVLVCAHGPVATAHTGAPAEIAVCRSADLLQADGRSRLATLDEMLAAVRRSPGRDVVVEAKPVDDVVGGVSTALVLADALRAAAREMQVTVSSFDAELLALIRTACAGLPVRTALLGRECTPVADVVRRARADGHDEVHLPLVGVRRSEEAVRAAHALGLSVALWTVNQPRDLSWAAGLGVAAVITDDVPGARATLHRTAA
jgi:glycerophosphoryl diester phosphodiesterase